MTKWLAGNGRMCLRCGGSGTILAPDFMMVPVQQPNEDFPFCVGFAPKKIRCPSCGGDGRMALTPAEILEIGTIRRKA